MDFASWLKAQMALRGWSCRELARHAGFSHSALNRVANGQIPPSSQLCLALAPALDLPPETVLRQAGYLSAITTSELENEALLVELFRQLTPEMQAYLLHLIRASIGYGQPLSADLGTDKPVAKNTKSFAYFDIR